MAETALTDAGAGGQPAIGYVRSLRDIYVANIRMGMQAAMQYRSTAIAEALLMLAEPVVYLLVWQAVVRAQGGDVEGYDESRIAAYYVAYALIRPFLQTGSPQNWEGWVREGRMSSMLLRPVHPVHQDNALWLGWALVRIVQTLPATVLMFVVFRPSFETSVAGVATLALALVLANQLRNLVSVMVGLSAFWLTRIAAVAAVNQSIEGLLSGRLVPFDMLPEWAQSLSFWLPFRWAFGFPIDTLAGGLDAGQLLVGLGMQAGWIVVMVVAMNAVWRRGVARYGAVGG